jgi:hypothetical protein
VILSYNEQVIVEDQYLKLARNMPSIDEAGTKVLVLLKANF